MQTQPTSMDQAPVLLNTGTLICDIKAQALFKARHSKSLPTVYNKLPAAGEWRTIVPEKYSFSCNGGEEYSVDDMLRLGTYNALIGETAYYSSKNTGTSCIISTYCKNKQCLHTGETVLANYT